MTYVLQGDDPLPVLTWHPIATAPIGEPVDLYGSGHRWTDFIQDERGRWTRKEGYPVVTRVLLVKPTHWMRVVLP